MDRRSLIAKIHMARARVFTCPVCGYWYYKEGCPDHPDIPGEIMSEFVYRETLKAIGGTDSCATMDLNGLAKVADMFDHAGYSEAYPYISPARESRRQRFAVIRQIRIRAPVVLGPTWEERVRGFGKKAFDKETLEFMDMVELRKVIGWINRTEKYRR